MAYLGNSPGVGSFIVSTERFNGTGSCTQFTITQTGIQDANAIEVLVNSIQQDPINSYSVANGVITFTEAPSSGANNIIVTYRATTVITYNNVNTSQIVDGAITATKIASGVLPTATANSAAVYANSAFLAANTPSYTANSAAAYANAAFLTANTPNYTANSGASYANSAFLAANSAFITANTPSNVANSAASYANSGFAVANSAASYANSAFSKANTVVVTIAGTTNQITANAATGNVVLSYPATMIASSNVQYTSLGIGTLPSNTTGEIRATNNITAYYSDDRLKTKLGNIENALDKVKNLTGFYYEANDVAQALGYTVRREVGLSAQTMQNVMPEIVTTAPIDDKYLTIWYEKTVPLLIEAIKELANEVEEIKKKLQ